MGETSRNTDMEELITYSNLVQILQSDEDTNAVMQCLQKSEALESQSDKDFYQVTKSIQGSNFRGIKQHNSTARSLLLFLL